MLNSEKTASVVSLGRRFLFAVGTVMAYFAADGMDELLCGARPSPFSGAAIAVASALAVLFVQYAVFDIPAMRLGRNFPEKTMAKLGGAMYAAFAVFLPFEFLSRRLGARLLPKKLKDLEVGFDYIDVEMMLRAEENDAEAITPYTGKIVKNAFKLQELDASDVMLPRSQVVYLDTECSNAENVARATESNHTRYPLCKDDLDNCFGIVHIKDIFINGGVANPDAIDFMKIRRETFRVRENDKLESALAKLLKYRLHMALVEDEFGGVIGVLTLDAALGELVGKIRDEFEPLAHERHQGPRTQKIPRARTRHTQKRGGLSRCRFRYRRSLHFRRFDYFFAWQIPRKRRTSLLEGTAHAYQNRHRRRQARRGMHGGD